MQYPAQALGLLVSEVLMDLDGQDTSREVALFVGFACTISVFFFPETTEKHRPPTTHTKLNNSDSFDASNQTNSIWGKLPRKLHTLWRDTRAQEERKLSFYFLYVIIAKIHVSH